MNKMNKINKIQSAIEKSVQKSKHGELIRATLSSLLSLSVIGTPLSNLIETFIPSRRFLRLEAFVNELAEGLRHIEDKIDLEYLQTDEFAFLFEQCFRSVSESYQREKIESFKAILINSLKGGNESQEQKEFYLNLVNQLTTIHIKMFKFFYDTYAYLQMHSIKAEEITGNIGHTLRTIFPEYNMGIISMVINDLYAFGLIDINHTNLNIITANQGMNLLGRKKTSPDGDKFYEFITI